MLGGRRGRYRLTVRSGARVERERFAERGAALDALERRGRELERAASGRAIDLKVRRFEPRQQVFGRLELSGPDGVRGGVDVRGDGESEAYLGRVARTVVATRDGESAYGALRRALEVPDG